MAKFKDSRDANLVVGAVLLITAMVVISVAVDSWIGKAAPYTQVEEINISSFSFTESNKIILIVENNGTAISEISKIWIDNEEQTFIANSTVIHPDECLELVIDYIYSNSTSYHFKILSERGNIYLFTIATF